MVYNGDCRYILVGSGSLGMKFLIIKSEQNEAPPYWGLGFRVWCTFTNPAFKQS